MNLYRAFLLALLIFVSASLTGCGAAIIIADAITGSTFQLDRAEAKFNAWLGKPKDERMKVIGPPETCMPLNAGGEVCEWVSRGVSVSNGTGHSWEHHIVYTYRDGIATEWSYRGDLGRRSSKDSQARQAANETVGGGVSQTRTASQSWQQSTLIGFFLEGASRQQVQETILARGGKFVSRTHSPEKDEFDSSQWIKESHRVGIIYTDAGQLAGLAVVWLVRDKGKASALATQLKSSLVRDFGPPSKNIGLGGWPLGYLWETKPVMAGVSGEGTEPEVKVMVMLASQEYATALPPVGVQ